jgi:HNH endonuclease
MGNRSGKEFSRTTMQEAFARQGGYCASCGIRIWKMGREGAMWHKFGESAEAHHVRPVLAGGTAHVENCVVVCRACHISAHQGGAWADISIYRKAEIEGNPVYASTEEITAEYPFYKLSTSNADELREINAAE